MKLNITGVPSTEGCITVTKSPTPKPGVETTAELLTKATQLHIQDVGNGIDFIIARLQEAKRGHDHTKLENMGLFLEAFNSGFTDKRYYEMHKASEKHHLGENFTELTLIDLLEHMVDGIVAGKARAGGVYPFNIPPALLASMVTNTAKLIETNITVID